MKRIFKITLALTASLIAFQSSADDIEAYLLNSDQKPNIVLIMDTSTSMNRLACPTDDEDPGFFDIIGGGLKCVFSGKTVKESRLDALKRAAKKVVNESRGVNLAIMRYNPHFNDAVGGYKAYSDREDKSAFESGRYSCLIAETHSVPSPEATISATLQDKCHTGGHFVSGMMNMDDPLQRQALINIIDTKIKVNNLGLQAWYNSATALYTPMVETTHEALRYFYGEPVSYGRYYDTTTKWFLGSIIPWKIAGWYWNNPSQKLLSHKDVVVGSPSSLSINDNPVYKSPVVANSQCQKNHIVLFTDGISTFDGESDAAIKSMIAGVPESKLEKKYGSECKTPSGSTEKNTDQSCLPALAYAMNTHLPDTANKPQVQLHTIAGFLSFFKDGQKMLRRAAELGGGSFAQADSVEEVEKALAEVFSHIDTSSKTMASPVIPLDDIKSLKLSNEVYYSLFEASKGPVWKGNVKRYRASLDGVVDVKGKKALDDDGFFKKTAHSYWSAEADGDRVTEGGFASILPATRNVKTNGNAKVVGGDDGDDFAAWLKSGEHKTLGDFLHTNPEYLDYEEHGRVLFVGSNSGYLHAIKTDKDNPAELSAFVPKELLPVAKQYFLGQADDINTSKLYGLDGPINIWHDDTNRNSIVDDNEKVYLYVGMRRGGNTYYAFDVSNPSDIKLEWQFDVPGQSWSKIRPINIKWEENGQETYKTVLVVAGGYDAAKEDHFEVKPNSSSGGVIYILDPLAANDAQRVLWSSANNTADIRDGAQMNRSIVGDIYLARNDSDYTNLLYVADIAGRIWRFDLDFGKKTPSSNNSELLVVGAMIADLSNGTERFYNSLEVTKRKRSFEYEVNDDGLKVNNSPRYILALGSGNRAFPNSDESAGKFYIVFDNHTSKVSHKDNYPSVIKREHLSEMSLANDSSSVKNLYPNADDSLGYAFTLKYATAGEKVLNKARIDNNLVIFNTYRKALVPFNEETCEPNLGDSMLYVVDLRNGTHESRVINVPGLPSPPTPFSDGGPEIHDPNADGRNDPDNENFEFDFDFLYWKEIVEQ